MITSTTSGINVHHWTSPWSGYYAWIKNTEKHAISEEQGYKDYLLLRCIYDVFIGKFGYRQLYMKVTELVVVPMNYKNSPNNE